MQLEVEGGVIVLSGDEGRVMHSWIEKDRVMHSWIREDRVMCYRTSCLAVNPYIYFI